MLYRVTFPEKCVGLGSLPAGGFGKRKYHRGRCVEGCWVFGGIQRGSDRCFLVVCPDNSRSEATLLPIIKQYVAPGTTIITDGWKAYINLGNHGYIHHDVKHCRNFVDPASGAHTNGCEGNWTHVKSRVLRRGGRRSTAGLALDLSQFMWLKQKGLLAVTGRSGKLFSTELPRLLNYTHFL